MKTSLPEMAVIEDLPPGKGAYSILDPERAVIEDFTPGKGGY